ncbi:MAG: HU family DNA-binding protein [Firmicutes bacterium]|nr:HU family DNA-binding protein [Bacillota bacterium]
MHTVPRGWEILPGRRPGTAPPRDFFRPGRRKLPDGGEPAGQHSSKEVFRTNKNELIAKVADRAGLSKKDSEKAINAFIDTVSDSLKAGQKVSVVGFGTFEVRERAARKGRNPQTGKEIEIPASRSPAFKAGKTLKDAIG